MKKILTLLLCVALCFSMVAMLSGCGGAGLIASNFPKLATAYANHPLVVAMGIYDANSGTINIDSLYNMFVLKMGSDKMPITIPKIGTIKMGREEFETLIKYIKES